MATCQVLPMGRPMRWSVRARTGAMRWSGAVVIMILRMPAIATPVWPIVRPIHNHGTGINVHNGRGRSIDSHFGGTASE